MRSSIFSTQTCSRNSREKKMYATLMGLEKIWIGILHFREENSNQKFSTLTVRVEYELFVLRGFNLLYLG